MSAGFRSAVAFALGALLAACTPAAPTAPAPAPAPSGPYARAGEPASQPPAQPAASTTVARDAPPDLRAFARQIGVECKGDAARLDCIGGRPEVGDIYDVELMPDCGPNGFFGGTVEKTELRDALPPNDETTLATLSARQIVCIQAIGRAGQDPAYFYVSVVPVAVIAQCRANKLCKLYGDQTVSGWVGANPACSITAGGAVIGSCPHGWARRESIEDFSNGM